MEEVEAALNRRRARLEALGAWKGGEERATELNKVIHGAFRSVRGELCALAEGVLCKRSGDAQRRSLTR